VRLTDKPVEDKKGLEGKRAGGDEGESGAASFALRLWIDDVESRPPLAYK